MNRYIVALSCILMSCQSKPKVTEVKGPDPSANPKLTKPTVRRSWVPTKIEADGRIMEDGHWRYEIEHESSWSN